MSYRITIVANTPEELDEKVRAYLGKEKVFVEKISGPYQSATDAGEDDEMEEVPSPYTGSPSLPTTTTETGDVDAEGLPWDKRIHSSSKKLNSDGTWRTARNLDKDVLAKVRAELLSKRVVGSTATQAAPVVTETLAVVTPPVQTQVAPTIPAMPTMQSGHTLDTFRSNFPLVMTTLISEGKVTQDYVNQLCSYFGVAQIWQASVEQQAMVFEQFTQAGIVKKIG